MKRPLLTLSALCWGAILSCAEPTSVDTTDEGPRPLLAHLPKHHGYVAVDLGTLGGPESQATYVNDLGQVVGRSTTADGHERVFFWADGVMTDVGTLGGTASRTLGALPSRGLGNGGHVIGWSATSGSDVSNLFLWHQGTMTDLGPLETPEARFIGIAWVNASGHVVRGTQVFRGGSFIDLPMDDAVAINDAGVVAGMLDINRLAIWDGSSLTDAGNLGVEDGFLIVYGINEAGYVTGRATSPSTGQQVAFLWDGNVLDELATLGSTDQRGAQPYDLNEAGDVVGTSRNPDGVSRAVLWSSGTLTELPTLGGTSSQARAINDAGQIVGSESTAGAPEESKAALWQGGDVYDLGTVGGAGARAVDINEAGWIVGVSRDLTGQERATLWRPADPEDLANMILDTIEDLTELSDDPSLGSLAVAVERALASMQRGNDTAATNQVRAFQNRVRALVQAGRLSSEDGEILLGLGDRLVERVSL